MSNDKFFYTEIQKHESKLHVKMKNQRVMVFAIDEENVTDPVVSFLNTSGMHPCHQKTKQPLSLKGCHMTLKTNSCKYILFQKEIITFCSSIQLIYLPFRINVLFISWRRDIKITVSIVSKSVYLIQSSSAFIWKANKSKCSWGYISVQFAFVRLRAMIL